MNATTPTAADRDAAEHAAGILRTTTAIRDRCSQLLARARRGESAWFRVDDGAIDAAAAQISDLARRRYPKLEIPFHSRWRHFEAGGVNRREQLEQLMEGMPPIERARSMVDLTVVSVLLDAGAGPDWKYVESATGQTFTRSEGLGIASFHAFTAGLFSGNRNRPLQVDATGLRALVTDRLKAAMQVSASNPLVGIDGRAVLLRRLGEVMAEQPEAFGTQEQRPAGLYNLITGAAGPAVAPTADVAVHDILSHLLMTTSGVWPTGNSIAGIPLGDCWRHAAVRGEGLSDGWVPFHKLSQWLTYSLLEPFQWSGVTLHGLDALTALPEYRNGGFLLDTGVLHLRDPSFAAETWTPGDEIIVEWRALTVALLDEVAVSVRRQLHTDEAGMPLVCVLEGGSWAVGRELAQRLRAGLPPLKVASDGTVF